jgi:hypothetical protein
MISLKINTDYFQNFKSYNLDSQIAFLRNAENKAFDIGVNGSKRTVRYEIDSQGNVQLYVKVPDNGAESLTTPTLRLNIGELLLPNAIKLDSDKKAPPQQQRYVPRPKYKSMGFNELSDNELDDIIYEIRKTGLIRLVKNQNI